MKRLTLKDENGCFLIDKTATVTWNSVIGENRYRGEAVDRFAAIEDILGDEYELDDLKTAMWCKETVGMAFSEDTAPVERLRELWFADKDGRCVVLDGKSRDKELICKLVRLFYWLEDCVKKKDFSPFRIVAGAPENNYPFISAFQRIENEYELEIHLSGKDEEAGAALATDC